MWAAPILTAADYIPAYRDAPPRMMRSHGSAYLCIGSEPVAIMFLTSSPVVPGTSGSVDAPRQGVLADGDSPLDFLVNTLACST
jgi:hypothetical protein